MTESTQWRSTRDCANVVETTKPRNKKSAIDVILLAGKGNETYQEINGVKHHMDEREIIHDVVEALGGKV